ncbi:MAG: AMP-binding protein [Thermodesulfobacteriota bacterium]
MTYDERPWLQFYDPWVTPEVVVPESTLVQRIGQAATQFPNKPALHFLGLTMDYGELISQAHRFSQALLAYGCKPGDVVAINLPNIPQFVVALAGSLRVGCAVSGISPLLAPPELAYELNDSRAKVLVTLDAIFEHRLKRVADQIPALSHVIATGILDYLSPVKRWLGRLLKKVPSGRVGALQGKHVVAFKEVLSGFPDSEPAVEVTPDHHCLVQYTGGTTGLPKGTILTHRNLIANLTQVETWLQVKLGTETLLSGFPFFHLAGLGFCGLALSLGGTQVLIPNPRDTRRIVGEMQRYHPTFLLNVPSLYMMLMEDPAFRKLDFSAARLWVSGASPFPAEAIRELEAIIGPGKVMEVYGMTEASPLITMNPLERLRKTGTVGVPIPSTRVRLVDLDQGTHQVPVGTEGELIASGPQVMKGYLNKPKETAYALREHDGEIWLHTGDIARMDQDGFFTIVDRSKDMLNVAGFKVFSREVEEKLYEHPAIEVCAIVGVPNPKRPGTEIVKLVVQPKAAFREQDTEKLKSDIIAFAREHFAPYKVPKLVEFTNALPMTPVGKVDKKALR